MVQTTRPPSTQPTCMVQSTRPPSTQPTHMVQTTRPPSTQSTHMVQTTRPPSTQPTCMVQTTRPPSTQPTHMARKTSSRISYFYIYVSSSLPSLNAIARAAGQFAFKTVTLKRPATSGRAGRAATTSSSPTNDEKSVELLVLHVGEDGGGGARISEVRAVVEKRRSLLHKMQVPCLYVRNQGRGLLTHPTSAYNLACLQC
ncbi:hypothetical protein FHG87_024054 [Trinorchestia longiramus]|nr:hypothetical protein FHG87_024054 [Trinorchestia longiramus]